MTTHDRLPTVTLPAVQPRGVIAVMSHSERTGDWELPQRLVVWTFMGRVRLDLRRARFLPGTSEIHITAILGEVRITLPHGVRVEADEIKVRRVSRAVPRADAPCVRITGHGKMGDVKIKVVDPDE